MNVGGVEEDRSPEFAPLGWMTCATVAAVDGAVSSSAHISTCVAKESEGESAREREGDRESAYAHNIMRTTFVETKKPAGM